MFIVELAVHFILNLFFHSEIFCVPFNTPFKYFPPLSLVKYSLHKILCRNCTLAITLCHKNPQQQFATKRN